MDPKVYTGTIYLIVNPVNNKKYVGQTTRDLKIRLYDHFKSDSPCIKLKRAINKYGKDSFKVRALKVFSCSDEETLHKQLDYWEMWYIAYYDSYKNGYNCTTGGQFTKQNLPEETRKKISATLTGRKKTQETIRKSTEAKSKKMKEVSQFDLEGNFIKRYRSVSEARRSFTGSRVCHITDVCNGKRHSTFGYIWKWD